MATFTVTTLGDVVDAGDGKLSLREAVSEANATAAADSIAFARGLEGRKLVLKGGELALSRDVTIDGGDGKQVTIDAQSKSRIFTIGGAATDVTLRDLTLTNGNAFPNPDSPEKGGAIYLGKGSHLRIARADMRQNVDSQGYGSGGAIFAAANSHLAIADSRLTGNTNQFGGAIYADSGSQVSVNRSRLDHNDANGYRLGQGGAISARQATVSIVASTLDGNQAYSDGGGLNAYQSRLTLSNSTIADNRNQGGHLADGVGGGIRVSGGSLTLSSSTVTGNVNLGYVPGSGINTDGSGQVRLANSIVAGNFNQYHGSSTPDDISTPDGTGNAITSSNGHNVFGSTVAGAVDGDVQGAAARTIFAALDPDTGGGRLGANGGPTPTVALRDSKTNPALSGADPLSSPTTDQRGVRRPLPAGTNPDIGAFELPQRSIPRTPSANNDVLSGTSANDVFQGLAGNDLVKGRAGNDRLAGNAGSDTLRGYAGNDSLRGAAGNDVFFGGSGNDGLDGGSGYDVVVESGKAKDFTVRRQGSAWLVTDRNKADGDAGRDRITTAELLRFDDRSLDLAGGRTVLSEDELVAGTAARDHGHLARG